MGIFDEYLAKYGEPALGLLSGAVAQPIAGWAGILSGGDADKVAQVQNALTYQPRTPQGQASTQALAKALMSAKQTMVDNNPPVNAMVQGYNQGTDYLGEISPMLGAAARTIPTAASILMGPGSSATRAVIPNVGSDSVAMGKYLLNRATENAMETPAMRGPLSNQGGAVTIFRDGKAVGKAPETSKEVMSYASRMQKLLDDANVPYDYDPSGIQGQGSQYFRIQKPAGYEGGDYHTFNVRIANHQEKYGGNDVYIDPQNQSMEEGLSAIREMYPALKKRTPAASKEIVPDDVLEQIFGKPINEIPESWVNRQRQELVKHPKGYWTQKR